MTENKNSVLYVCVHNAGRSQMAAGFTTALSAGRVEVRSAGSMPASQINPVAAAAMLELGIDITGEQPKMLTPDAVERATVAITMGCGDVCPVFPNTKYEDWELDDPAGEGIEPVRVIRDEIRGRVVDLLERLGEDVADLGTPLNLSHATQESCSDECACHPVG